MHQILGKAIQTVSITHAIFMMRISPHDFDGLYTHMIRLQFIDTFYLYIALGVLVMCHIMDNDIVQQFTHIEQKLTIWLVVCRQDHRGNYSKFIFWFKCDEKCVLKCPIDNRPILLQEIVWWHTEDDHGMNGDPVYTNVLSSLNALRQRRKL